MKTYQQGVSMLEILITIVVISFGFLSLASFQMNTLNHLSGTNQHFLVTSLASSMGESIRANWRSAGEYGIASLDDISKNCSASGANCSVVEYDLWMWKEAIEQHALEDIDAVIDEITESNARITLSWKERSGGSASAVQNYVLQVPF